MGKAKPKKKKTLSHAPSFIAGLVLSGAQMWIIFLLLLPLIAFVGFGFVGLASYYSSYWYLFTIPRVLTAYGIAGLLFLCTNTTFRWMVPKRYPWIKRGMHYGNLFLFLLLFFATFHIADYLRDLANHEYYFGGDPGKYMSVLASGDMKKCNAVREGDERAGCVSVFAVAKSDPQLCLTLTDESMPFFSEKDACLMKVIWSKNRNYLSHDADICLMIENPTIKATCISEVLHGGELVREDNEWVDPQKKDDFVAACAALETETDEDLVRQARCYRDSAVTFLDSTICTKIPPYSAENVRSERDLCLYHIAVRVKDEALCEGIAYPYLAKQCIECTTTVDDGKPEYYCDLFVP